MRILTVFVCMTLVASAQVIGADLTTEHQYHFSAPIYGSKNDVVETYSTAVGAATLTINYFHAGPNQGHYEESCYSGSRRNGGGYVECDRDPKQIERDFKHLKSLFLAAQKTQKTEKPQ